MRLLREAVEAAAVIAGQEIVHQNDEIDVSASISSSSSSGSSALSLSASLSVADENSSASIEVVPLALRLFEYLAAHSEQSDTWRYLLRESAPDFLAYLSRQSDLAVSCTEDPFYPGVEHEIRLQRRRVTQAEQDDEVETLHWRIGRTVCLTLDSSESTITLTRCSQDLSVELNNLHDNDCCSLRCWPVGSLRDYARCLDAVYLRSCRLWADRVDLMRGRYHGCRRG